MLEGIETEQSTRTAVWICRMYCSSIENGSHQAVLVDSQPSPTGKEILTAIDPRSGVE